MSDNFISSDICLKSFVERERREAERLLEQVEEPNTLKDEEYGRTLLHWAAHWGWQGTVEKLVEHYHCDPMVRSNDGRVPLHDACFSGFLKVVQYLIVICKCDSMCEDDNGWKPLHSACAQGGYYFDFIMCLGGDTGWDKGFYITRKLDIISYLIEECKCDPMCRDNDGITPLHLVCGKGNVNEARYLITQSRCDPTCRAKNGLTPLHSVCLSSGFPRMISYLIEVCKCDPMCTMSDGSTPLHAACARGNIDAVKCLITQYKCDPMCKNSDGLSPLHSACYKEHVNVVKYLITQYRCDPMNRANNGVTPLHIACCISGNLELIGYLIEECYCNPKRKTTDGYAPLHLVCSKGTCNIDAVKYLITQYKCDPTLKGKNGDTPLHSVCRNSGNLDVICYLIEECKCDPMCKNSDGWTPLHYACYGGHVNVAKYLITQCRCDPMCRANNGATSLHIACWNSDNLELIRYLIDECKCDPMCKNSNGYSPLHSACYGGHVNVAKYLITQCKCDPMCEDYYADTPLHLACVKDRNLDVVRYLIEECKCDPMIRDSVYNTPLHIACDKGQYAIAEYLLCTDGINPACRNLFYRPPGHSIRDNALKSLLKKFIQYGSCLTIDSYVNIFVLGDCGVGKTTLTEVIKQRAKSGFWFGQYRFVQGVNLHTAGIIPHRLEHGELGNIIVHDLAGHPEYYSSHIAVLENITQGSAAVFIIVVKLSEEVPYRWLSIVNDLSNRSSSVCYVLTVASHADAVDGEVRRKELAQELEVKISSRLVDESKLQSKGVFYLDCRKLDSSQFSVFKDLLSAACYLVRNSINIKKVQSRDKIYCKMLYLLMEIKGQNVYTLETIHGMVKESLHDYYLPETEEKILLSLNYLHHVGLIIFINTPPKGSWVVFKKQTLLAEVNGKIFASKIFKPSATGIVSQKSFCQLFPQYDPEMLLEFLISLELCGRVTDDIIKMTSLSPNSSENDAESELLFFPCLISYNKRPIITEPFKFGWCLQCIDEHGFFSPRFLHLLILHLAYKHALPELRCTIWSTGILWPSGYGVQTLVELVDNSRSVILLMSSQEGLQCNMIPLRRRVIADILSIKQEACPSVKVNECIIRPSQLDYPIEKPFHLVLFDIEGIASSIVLNKPCVVSYNKCMHTSSYVEEKMCDLFPLEYDKGQDISVFVGRDIEILKMPGGFKIPNTVSSSLVDVFKKYGADLKKLVSVSVSEEVASCLYSADLIPFPVLGKLQATGLSPYEKASILFDEVQRSISGTNMMEKFRSLCKILKKQCCKNVEQIVLKMEKEAGMPPEE